MYILYVMYTIIYIYSNKYDQTKNNMDILHCLQLYFFGNPKFPREDGPVLEPSTGLRLTQWSCRFFGGDGWQTELFVYFSSLAMLQFDLGFGGLPWFTALAVPRRGKTCQRRQDIGLSLLSGEVWNLVDHDEA